MAFSYTIDGEKDLGTVRLVYGTWTGDATLTYGAVHVGVRSQVVNGGAAVTSSEVTITGTGIGTGVVAGMYIEGDAWSVGLTNKVSTVPDANTIVLTKAAAATATVTITCTKTASTAGLIAAEVTNSVTGANTTAHAALDNGGTLVITAAASDAGQWAMTYSR